MSASDSEMCTRSRRRKYIDNAMPTNFCATFSLNLENCIKYAKQPWKIDTFRDYLRWLIDALKPIFIEWCRDAIRAHAIRNIFPVRKIKFNDTIPIKTAWCKRMREKTTHRTSSLDEWISIKTHNCIICFADAYVY